jgi:hypothetical protein
MKIRTILLILFNAQIVAGQGHQDTLISKASLDSLYLQIFHKNRQLNQFMWEYVLTTSVTKKDTLSINPDSLVIRYWSKAKQKLAQEEIKLHKAHSTEKSCQEYFTMRYFDGRENVVYIEYYKGLCEEPQPIFGCGSTPIGVQIKNERFVYDQFGRLEKHVILEYGKENRNTTYCVTYSYDGNGESIKTMRPISQHQFWD